MVITPSHVTYLEGYPRGLPRATICFVSYFADEDVYRRFAKHNYVLSFIHCHGICVCIVFFTVNSSVNAAGDHLAGGSFTEKELN